MQLQQKLQLRHRPNRVPARGGVRCDLRRDSRRDSPTPGRVKRHRRKGRDAQVESCSRDPIGFEGSQWNLYEYVDGGPVVRTDPQGLGWWCENLCQAGCFSSAAMTCAGIGVACVGAEGITFGGVTIPCSYALVLCAGGAGAIGAFCDDICHEFCTAGSPSMPGGIYPMFPPNPCPGVA